jgi:hypothetical protein
MNIFQKLGIGIADVGKWIADAVKDVIGIASKVKVVLSAEEKLEPSFVTGLSLVVADLETVVAGSAAAVTSDGLNFGADSAVYADFVKLVADFKALLPIVDQSIAILKANL